MASVKKFTDKAVKNEIRHNNREIRNDRNKDIDSTRTYMNYKLSPQRDDYAYYKQRKSELYCYNRKDVKTLAGWIVTAPKELKAEEEADFFKKTYEFLSERYGEKNVINATVHYDEGKKEKVYNSWGEYVGERLVLGRPHLHFLFIPVVRDGKHAQGEKICCCKVLNRLELQLFHGDLQAYTQCQYIKNGSTKEQGRNYTVRELKERYETEKELERLREIEKKYNREHERERGSRWE